MLMNITCLAANTTFADADFRTELLSLSNGNAFNSLKVELCLHPHHDSGKCSSNVAPYLQCTQGGHVHPYVFVPPATRASFFVQFPTNESSHERFPLSYATWQFALGLPTYVERGGGAHPVVGPYSRGSPLASTSWSGPLIVAIEATSPHYCCETQTTGRFSVSGCRGLESEARNWTCDRATPSASHCLSAAAIAAGESQSVAAQVVCGVDGGPDDAVCVCSSALSPASNNNNNKEHDFWQRESTRIIIIVVMSLVVAIITSSIGAVIVLLITNVRRRRKGLADDLPLLRTMLVLNDDDLDGAGGVEDGAVARFLLCCCCCCRPSSSSSTTKMQEGDDVCDDADHSHHHVRSPSEMQRVLDYSSTANDDDDNNDDDDDNNNNSNSNNVTRGVIPFSWIVLQDQVGQGASGAVFRGELCADGVSSTAIALKQMFIPLWEVLFIIFYLMSSNIFFISKHIF